MSTADAAWEDMAREGQRQDEQVAKLLRRSMATSGRSAATAKTKPKPSHSVSLPVGMSIAAPPSRPTIEQPAETVSFNLQREINRLASDQQTARKQAALALESHFLARDQAAPVDPDVFAELAKPLFRRFNDRVEKVREMAVRLATRGLAHEQDLLRYLPYLMPALSSRLDRGYALDEANQVFSRDTFLHDAFKRGRVFVDARDVQRQRPDEPSEELRLLMLELVDAVLQNAFNRNAASILHAYIFDVVLLLVASAHDDFHEVNVAACRLLAKLSNNMVSVIKHVSVALVRSLMPLLAHRLARVRVAAIEAIDALVTCPDTSKCKGSGSDAIVDLLGYRDENVIPISAFYSVEVRINYFAKLDQDGNPSVRATFFAMVGDWMLHLPDWYDHESRLLPYLLSAVSDTHDEIAQRALDTLRQLGDRYERDHGEDVLEIKQYGVDGKNPTYNYAAPLPAPFAASGRPSLGTRLLIRGRAKRFLGPILRELGSWQAATRQHAVLLLKCVLVYCEESLTAELHLLLATLLRTWRQDAELQGELETVAELVGRFSAPDTYMPLLLARVRGDEDVAAEGGGGGAPAVHTATGLELLSCLMRGSLDRSLLPHVPDVLAALTQSHVTEFESPSVKLTLAELVLQITQLLDRTFSVWNVAETRQDKLTMFVLLQVAGGTRSRRSSSSTAACRPWTRSTRGCSS